jgi:capsid protein
MAIQYGCQLNTIRLARRQTPDAYSEHLAMDPTVLTQTNYSSLRAGKIEVRPIADRFHAQGALLGLWAAEMPDGVRHVPPAHEMIDPLKDTTALIAQVRAGFVPQPEAAGAFGYDFRAAVEMTREANALLDEAGLALDTNSRRVAKSGAAQDAAQMAAVEIAATGAAAPPRDTAPRVEHD